MEFSRQKHSSGLPSPSPGDHPKPGIEPRSPAMQADSLPSGPPEKPELDNSSRIKQDYRIYFPKGYMEILKYLFKVTKQGKETMHVPAIFWKVQLREWSKTLRAASSMALSPVRIFCLRSGVEEKNKLMKLWTFLLKCSQLVRSWLGIRSLNGKKKKNPWDESPILPQVPQASHIPGY